MIGGPKSTCTLSRCNMGRRVILLRFQPALLDAPVHKSTNTIVPAPHLGLSTVQCALLNVDLE